MLHMETVLVAAFTMYAFDPDIAIPRGPLKPEAACVHPDTDVPDIVHAVTVLALALVTKIVEPDTAIPYG